MGKITADWATNPELRDCQVRLRDTRQRLEAADERAEKAEKDLSALKGSIAAEFERAERERDRAEALEKRLRQFCEARITEADRERASTDSVDRHDYLSGGIDALNDVLRRFGLLDSPEPKDTALGELFAEAGEALQGLHHYRDADDSRIARLFGKDAAPDQPLEEKPGAVDAGRQPFGESGSSPDGTEPLEEVTVYGVAPHVKGPWVRHEDHDRIVSSLRERLERERDEAEQKAHDQHVMVGEAHTQLEEARELAERRLARYDECRAEFIEQFLRAKRERERADSLQKAVRELAEWAGLAGAGAAGRAKTIDEADWHAGVRTAFDRIERKLLALLDTEPDLTDYNAPAALDTEGSEECGVCEGTGNEEIALRSLDGNGDQEFATIDCEDCHGHGKRQPDLREHLNATFNRWANTRYAESVPLHGCEKEKVRATAAAFRNCADFVLDADPSGPHRLREEGEQDA